MNFSDLKYIVYTDFFRQTGKNVKVINLFKTILLNNSIPGFSYILNMRICYYLSKKSSLLSKIILRPLYYRLKKMQYMYGIEIPYTTKIDKGLLIPHIGNITINGNAIIGKNCTILQGVTIGNDLFKSKDIVAKIGDNVTIGAGTKIIGPCVVGNNVTIGANSVVVKDIPDNVVVAGIPAKIVSHKKSITININYMRKSDYLKTK